MTTKEDENAASVGASLYINLYRLRDGGRPGAGLWQTPQGMVVASF